MTTTTTAYAEFSPIERLRVLQSLASYANPRAALSHCPFCDSPMKERFTEVRPGVFHRYCQAGCRAPGEIVTRARLDQEARAEQELNLIG